MASPRWVGCRAAEGLAAEHYLDTMDDNPIPHWAWEQGRGQGAKTEGEHGERRENGRETNVVADSGSDHPYRDSHDHLLDELNRIDFLLWLRVERWRAETGDPTEEFAGYYIPDEKIDRLLRPGSNDWDDDPVSSGVLYEEQLEHATRLLERVEGRKRATLERGIELRLAALAERFGLGRPALDILLIGIAPAFDPKYETVNAYLHDDLTRKRPSVDLVLRTFSPSAKDRLDARALFARTSPLRRNGLIRLTGDEETALPTRSILADGRIVEYLLGTDTIDDALGEFVETRSPERRPETLPGRGRRDERSDSDGRLDELILDADIRTQLGNLAHREERPPDVETTPDPLMAHFYGPYGSGRSAAVAALCADRGRELVVADARGLVTNRIRETAELLIREARLRDADVSVSNLGSLGDETAADIASLLGVLDGFDGRVYLSGKEPLKTSQRLGVNEHALVAVHFPIPSYDCRRALWNAVDALPAEADIADLAGKFRLTGGQIEDAVATANSQTYGGALTAEDIYAGCRAQSRETLSTLGRVVEPTYDWADIVLPDDKMSHLREVAAHIRQQGRVYADWGFERKFSLGNGVVALFTGPSGTGKTMAAEIIANDAELDLYKIDLSSVVSKYIGETEKNLGEVFDEAENSNAILFFDEADALFGKRSEVSDAHDRYANIEVNYLLQRVEEHDGAVILTTNFEKNIDDAFLRRIHLSVDFPLPDKESREAIWRRIFPAETPCEELDFAFLAEFDLTGGNIKNIAMTAAVMAAEDDSPVGMEYVAGAVKREFQKIGKLIRSEDFGEYRDIVS